VNIYFYVGATKGDEKGGRGGGRGRTFILAMSTLKPSLPSTCLIVFKVSTGMRKMRQEAAVAEAAAVLTRTGRSWGKEREGREGDDDDEQRGGNKGGKSKEKRHFMLLFLKIQKLIKPKRKT